MRFLKNKRILGIGLGLLTLALWVGPIVMAFQTNDWSLKQTLLPGKGQLGGVQSNMQEIINKGTPSQDSFSLVDNTITEEEISFEIAFTSSLESDMEPFDTINIENASLVMSNRTDNTEIVTLKLEEPVEIGPGEEKSIILSGTPTAAGKQMIRDAQDAGSVMMIFQNSEITGGIVRLRIAGLIIKISPEKMVTAMI